MVKKFTRFVLLFFLLLTFVNVGTGWVETIFPEDDGVVATLPSDWGGTHQDDLPVDAEEDATEKREADEYESHFILYEGFGIDPLLNLHYTYQHLLFKEHHAELIVPPPKA
jgi:hypothetical protein